MADAALAEVMRGGRIESRHGGGAVVTDAGGRVIHGRRRTSRAAEFPRSAVKAILALPLVETGAADRLGLGDDELALACASHTGEARHVALAASALRKAGLTELCLECGTHWPTSRSASHALAAAGQSPGPLHNNCSGKHAGFVLRGRRCGPRSRRVCRPRPSGDASGHGRPGRADLDHTRRPQPGHRWLRDPDLCDAAERTGDRLRPASAAAKACPWTGPMRPDGCVPPWLPIRSWWPGATGSTPGS